MNNWESVWKSKRLDSLRTSLEPVETGLLLNGYDAPTGAGLTRKTLTDFVAVWSEKVECLASDSVYEVGCGSGALLEIIRTKLSLAKVSGCDYSASLVEIGRSLFKEIDLESLDAKDLDSTSKFEHLISFSVFFYFPTLEFAREVLDVMKTKAAKSVSICDVPNLLTKNACEAFRRGAWLPGEYDKAYAGLEHLYYSEEFFLREFDPFEWNVVIERQEIPNYSNSPYRFNVFATRI